MAADATVTPMKTTITADSHVTEPDTKAQLLNILQNLPTAPSSGFTSSSFAMFIILALSIISVGLLPLVIPATASLGIWFGALSVIVLGLFAMLYSIQRFALKQSNINLLSLGLTVYRDVQGAAKTFKIPAQLPDAPAPVVTAAAPTVTTTTTTEVTAAAEPAPAVEVSTIAAH